MLAATLRNDARMSFLLRLRLGVGAVSVKTTKDSNRSRLVERKTEDLDKKKKEEDGLDLDMDKKKEEEDGGGEALLSILSFFSE